MNNLSVLDAFSIAGCTKTLKFERVMTVQTHTRDEENGEFFWFFQKSSNLV